MWTLLPSVLLACASPPPEGRALARNDPPRDVVAAETRESALIERCVERCAHQRQMRAVGWELIQAECRAGCLESASAPGAIDAATLAAVPAGRVRIEGRLVRVDGRALIELADGKRLPLPSDPDVPDGPCTLLGGWSGSAIELVDVVYARP